MIIRVLKAASDEWFEAIGFYENRQRGLGRKLDNAIQISLRYLENHPHGGPKCRRDIRRKRIIGWPHSILYKVNENELIILAIMHERQAPITWEKRILELGGE